MITEDYVSGETRADRQVSRVRHGIKEDYVSFETAKLLKEKGFDEITLAWYTGKGKFCTSKNSYNDYHMNEFSDTTLKHKNTCSAPTLQMAMKWLREVHNLWCEISWEGKGLWCMEVFSLADEEFIHASIVHEIKSYEQACEAGIKFCLTHLI